jgi:hypothetical protein
VLRVFSAKPVSVALAWRIPTSRSGKEGSSKYVGRSWSHSAVVYGNPAYAQLLVLSGPEGVPVTCQIVVDGRVSDDRSTTTPYGSTMCQG